MKYFFSSRLVTGIDTLLIHAILDWEWFSVAVVSKYFWLPCETREVIVACLGCKYAFEKQQHIEVILMSVLYVKWTSWHTYSTLHQSGAVWD